MVLEFRRTESTIYNATFSDVYLDGQALGLFGLENTELMIPIGEYEADVYLSPKAHGFPVLLLKNVPDRSYIEMHPANWPHQLEGCIAPGKLKDVASVHQSKWAFDSIMHRLSFPLTVKIS